MARARSASSSEVGDLAAEQEVGGLAEQDLERELAAGGADLVAQRRGPIERGLHRVRAVAAHDQRRGPAAELDLELGLGPGRVVEVARRQDRERAVEQAHRAGVGRGPEEGGPRGRRPRRLARLVAGLAPVVGELRRPGLAPALEHGGDPAVQSASLGRLDRVEQDLADPGVGELPAPAVDVEDAEVLARRIPAGEVVAGDDLIEQVGVDVGADHGGVGEQAADLVGQPPEALADRVLDRGRRDLVGQDHVGDAVDRAGAVGQGPQDLDREQRVAGGVADQQLDQVGSGPELADHGHRELGQLVATQPRQVDPFGAGHVGGVGLGRGHDQERHRRRGPGQVGEQRGALAAGPVGVVEQQHHRTRRPAEQGLDLVLDLDLQRLRVERRRCEVAEVEQLAEVGQDQAEERPGDVGGLGTQVEDQRPERGAPRVVGEPAVADLGAAQDQRAGDQRGRAQLVEQTRLAGAALADDLPDRAGAAPGPVEGLDQPAALGGAPDEPGAAHDAVAQRVALRHRAPGRVAEQAQGLPGAGRAPGRVARQQAADQLGEGGQLGHLGRDLGRQVQPGLGRQALAQGLALVGALERVLARQRLERDHAEREQVGRLRRRIAGDHLRCDVADRAGGDRAPAAFEREAEVEDADRAVGDQHVRRLEVAVEDAAPVQVGERLEQLDQEVDPAGEVALGGGEVDRHRAIEQLHRDERLAAGVEAVVEDADDVGVAERGQDPELLGQGEGRDPVARAGPVDRGVAGDGRGRGIERRLGGAGHRRRSPGAGRPHRDGRRGLGRRDGQALERDRPPGQAIGGAEHRTHPATSEPARDPIATDVRQPLVGRSVMPPLHQM